MKNFKKIKTKETIYIIQLYRRTFNIEEILI